MGVDLVIKENLLKNQTLLYSNTQRFASNKAIKNDE